MQHPAQVVTGQTHDLDLPGHFYSPVLQSPDDPQALNIQGGNDGIQLRILVQQLHGALIAILEGIHLLVRLAENLLQAVPGHPLAVSLPPPGIGAQVQGPGHQADVAAAPAIEIFHGVVAAGFVVAHHAADLRILAADHLYQGNAAGLDVRNEPVVSACGVHHNAVHQTVAHPGQAFLFNFRIVVRHGDDGAVAQGQGLVLKALQNLREYGQIQPGNHHAQGMPPPLPQGLGHDVGMVAQLLGGGIDPGLGVRVDIGCIVQCPGDGAHIHTGKLCHIL